jgi:hypothetical protein
VGFCDGVDGIDEALCDLHSTRQRYSCLKDLYVCLMAALRRSATYKQQDRKCSVVCLLRWTCQ